MSSHARSLGHWGLGARGWDDEGKDSKKGRSEVKTGLNVQCVLEEGATVLLGWSTGFGLQWGGELVPKSK